MPTYKVSEVVFDNTISVKYYSFPDEKSMVTHMIRDVNTDICDPESGLTQLERDEIYDGLRETIFEVCESLDEYGRGCIDWKEKLDFDGLMGYVWLLKRCSETVECTDDEYDLCDIYTPGENGNDRDEWSDDGAPDTHPHLCESDDE